ncbi:glycosyltransferase family 4 protein [Lentisphaera profundi]|uniref:Glycosyltransferase family 4 protein n=1 Tax=Lentisphaera profundi TaxID=1658616 RepID=A0ABY7VZA6_9BACT|nr:glycosyltransferase family 4 protein [Lentisphaera profundi]WDE98202.1 glycosyltransferase family 4 protein [Lentisphaera profundi]
MKIALLTDGLYPYVLGGIQKHSFYLAKYLAREKIKVHIIHCVAKDQGIIEELEGFSEAELKLISFSCIRKRKPKSYPGHYIRESYLLSKLMFETMSDYSQFDFIYAQGFTGWHYGRVRVKDKSLPPLITNFHGLEMFQHAASLKEKLKQELFKWPVTHVSRLSGLNCSLGGKLTAILENLVSPNKIIETPIGISEDWLIDSNTIQRNKIRKFVFVGRYERRKGIEELSAVLKTLIHTQNFEFHFIGPIPEGKQISSKKIIYHGLLEEAGVKELLCSADLLVCPSYSEGMPTVILEAMANGCAIIASDVGAVSEEVDKSNGILIEAGSKEQLKDAILDFIKMNDEQLIKLKEASLQRVREQFLWSKVIMQNLKKITDHV